MTCPPRARTFFSSLLDHSAVLLVLSIHGACEELLGEGMIKAGRQRPTSFWWVSE